MKANKDTISNFENVLFYKKYMLILNLMAATCLKKVGNKRKMLKRTPGG